MRLRLSTVARLLCVVTVMLAAGAGCGHVTDTTAKLLGYQPVAAANAQIAAVQADATVKEAAIEAQITAADKAITDLKQSAAQEASNHLFGSQLSYAIDPTPSDYEQIMHSEDLAAATTLPAPDTVTVASKMDQIKKLLSDKQHLIDSLNANVAAAQAKAAQIANQEKSEEGQVKTLTDQKAQLVTDTNAKVTIIQGEKDTAVNAKLAKDQELLSTKASIDAIKTKVTIAAFALAALLAAAAVFSPLLKLQLGELAGIFAATGVAIPYVQPWMVATGLGVLLLVVVWHIVATHTAVVATVTPAPAKAPILAPAPVVAT